MWVVWLTRKTSAATIRIPLNTKKLVELRVRSTLPKVLIVDDDPSHLEIYGLLLKQAGYEPVPALVRFSGADFPADPNIRGIILDSRLNSIKSSSDLARQIGSRYPRAPIVLLSDFQTPRSDLTPYVTDYVRRGDPAGLLEKLSVLVAQSADRSAGRYERPLVPCPQ